VVLLDDAVGDGEAEPGPDPHVLGREERIEDALLESFRDAGAGITHGHAHVAHLDGTANGDELTRRVRHGVTRVGQQVDEDLLELDGVGAERHLLRPSTLQPDANLGSLRMCVVPSPLREGESG
jgi:hypothetical protein